MVQATKSKRNARRRLSCASASFRQTRPVAQGDPPSALLSAQASPADCAHTPPLPPPPLPPASLYEPEVTRAHGKSAGRKSFHLWFSGPCTREIGATRRHRHNICYCNCPGHPFALKRWNTLPCVELLARAVHHWRPTGSEVRLLQSTKNRVGA